MKRKNFLQLCAVVLCLFVFLCGFGPMKTLAADFDFDDFGSSDYAHVVYDNAKYTQEGDNPYYTLAESVAYDITTCTIHSDTKAIEKYAFADCANLKEIIIKNGVVTIGEGAFEYCKSLESITIFKSVTEIGEGAFLGCTGLKNIRFTGSIKDWKEISGYEQLMHINIQYDEACPHEYLDATCTKPKTCKYCDETNGAPLGHTYNKSVATATYLKSAATCTKKAVYYKSCACGAKGTETFESGSMLAHTYDKSVATATYLKSAATCTQKALYYKSCVCGAKSVTTFESGSVLAHAYDKSVATATYLKSAASCTAKAVYYKSCVCGAKGTATFEDGNMLAHTYNQNVATTAFFKSAATCTQKAVYYKSCACGAKGMETFESGNALGHAYSSTFTIDKTATLTAAGAKSKHCTREGCSATTENTTIHRVKTVKLSATSYTYDGKTKTPTVTVKDAAGNTLKKGTDYTATVASSKKAGTYKVTVKMVGEYTGTKTLTYKINPISISKCKVKLSATSYTYNGKTKTPKVTVKDAAGKTLKNKTDYTATVASGKKVGTYTVTVKMKGNYSGTKTLKYTIVPVAKTSLTVVFGKTISIGAKSNTTVKYTVAKKAIATVNAKGVITAKKAGTTTVTVKSGTITQKVTVKVTNPKVTITAKTNSVKRGSKLNLKATADVTGVKVKWSVNNKKIATISSSGVLTGKKQGKVKVTAAITYKGKTFKATYNVTVKVQEPKVKISATKSLIYGASIEISVTNKGSLPLKVLAKGYKQNGYDGKRNIDAMTVGGKKASSVTIAKGATKKIKLSFGEDFTFLGENTLYALHMEYDGETYIVTCQSGKIKVTRK